MIDDDKLKFSAIAVILVGCMCKEFGVDENRL